MGLVVAKCTNCGANLEVDEKLDAAICPYCNSAYIVEKAISNYNIGSINANVVNVYGNISTVSNISNSVQELSNKVMTLKNERRNHHPGLIGKVSGKTNPIDEELLSLINNYQIPNTKDDITEFMIYASSLVNPNVFDDFDSSSGTMSVPERNQIKKETNAWIAKMEQAYNKANLMFPGTEEFIKLQNLYLSVKGNIQKSENRSRRIVIMALVVSLLIIIVMAICFFIDPNLKELHK